MQQLAICREGEGSVIGGGHGEVHQQSQSPRCGCTSGRWLDHSTPSAPVAAPGPHLVRMVAGGSRSQTVRIDTSGEARLVGGLLDAPVDCWPGPRKLLVSVHKPLDTQLNSQRQIERYRPGSGDGLGMPTGCEGGILSERLPAGLAADSTYSDTARASPADEWSVTRGTSYHPLGNKPSLCCIGDANLTVTRNLPVEVEDTRPSQQ